MQVRLDVHEAHIRKQERDLHTDTTSHPPASIYATIPFRKDRRTSKRTGTWSAAAITAPPSALTPSNVLPPS